jgi:hypothetical protein
MVTLHEHHQEWASGTALAPVSVSAAAIAVIVLTILGLVDVVPNAMTAIATIVVGAAILLRGAQMVGEYSRLLTPGAAMASAPDASAGGLTLEFLAGGVGIVLGILALFSHTPTLTPAALIVFGGTLLLMGAMTAREAPTSGATAAATPQDQTPSDYQLKAILAQMAGVASGSQIMIGIAAMVLGILALVPMHDTILTLVGLLAVGTALLTSAVATGGAVMTMLHH